MCGTCTLTHHNPSTLFYSLIITNFRNLEAILFDCDGVLAETERDGHRISFNNAFTDAAIEEEWSVERYGKLLVRQYQYEL